MDLADLETIATSTYERHGFSPDRAVSTFKLARKIHGSDCIVRPHTLLGAYPASTTHLEGRPRFALRKTVPDDEAQFYIGHELAHDLLGLPHGKGAEIESACDYLAACLIAPRAAVVALYRAFGWDLRAIADEVVATQTWAALRLAETMREPLAAISPIAVRVRGPEEWVWPSEPEIRRMARRPGPGIKKIRVTDRPKRAVILADGSL